jgi:Restriction endonuclease
MGAIIANAHLTLHPRLWRCDNSATELLFQGDCMQHSKAIVSKLMGVEDWNEFEEFVNKLYSKNENAITVERNFKTRGVSGRLREVDVLVKFGFNPHILSLGVECKYWANKVNGDIIDVAYAKKEDLKLDKYAVITTIGFEAGAELYAKSKGIDLFLIRPSKDDDFGYSGKVINFKLILRGSKPINIKLNTTVVVESGNPAVLNHIHSKISNINVEEEGVSLDKELDLYRFSERLEPSGKKTYLRGDYVSNLHKLIYDAWSEHNSKAWNEKLFNLSHVFKFNNPTAMHLNEALVFIQEISFDIEFLMSKSEFQIDRGLQYPLVLENVIERAITPLKSGDDPDKNEFTMSNPVAMELVDLANKPDDVLGRDGAQIVMSLSKPMGVSSSDKDSDLYVLVRTESGATWQKREIECQPFAPESGE